MLDTGLAIFLAKGAVILLIFLVLHFAPLVVVLLGLDRQMRRPLFKEHSAGDIAMMVWTPAALAAMIFGGYAGPFFRYADKNFLLISGLAFGVLLLVSIGVWLGRISK